MSLFGRATSGGPRPLVQFKTGKMSLSGTTMSAETRKGELAIHQSEDGLMHVTWTDLSASAAEDDLIVFPNEVSLKRLAACKDAYAMVLSWTTSSRKLFFWSQELRKKGAPAEDTKDEDALVAKFNQIVDNPPTPGQAAAAGAAGAGGTIGGLSQSNYNELMAMLQRNAGGGTRMEPAPPTPAAAAAAAPDAAGAAATPNAPSSAATPAAPIAPRAPVAETPAGAPITSEGLQAILRGVMQHSRTAQQDGSLLPELFSREELLDVVRRHRAEFEQLLRPHLAPTEPADTVEETLSSPQLRQAVGQLAAALNSQNAEQIFAELNLRPQSAGVLGFIEAMQQQADATGAPATDMDTS